jgi:hypothetical protein
MRGSAGSLTRRDWHGARRPINGGRVTVRELERELARLEKQSARFAAARAALPPGSSRARVTTANARWARVAEARERVSRELEAARGETKEATC